jgi:hypothetical protein
MEIGGGGCHRAAGARVIPVVGAFIGLSMSVNMVCRHKWMVGRIQTVLQIQNEKIARLQTKVGRDVALSVKVAVADCTVGFDIIVNREIGF